MEISNPKPKFIWNSLRAYHPLSLELPQIQIQGWHADYIKLYMGLGNHPAGLLSLARPNTDHSVYVHNTEGWIIAAYVDDLLLLVKSSESHKLESLKSTIIL